VALLNSQPMGFYAPAQLVADARKHGVRVRGVDVNHSDCESSLERDPNCSGPAIRLGLQTIRGLPAEAARRVMQVRQQEGPYPNLDQFARRTALGRAAIATLADADAFCTLAGDRRAAVWQSLGQNQKPGGQPLLEGVDDDESVPDQLTPMSPLEEVYADYNTTGLSLKSHPISFARRELNAHRCVTASQLPRLRDGRHVRVAGLVLLRQRPSTAKGITFVTLEDETGSINLVLFPAVWKRFFKIARGSNAWLVDGKLENREGVIHVIVGRITDLADEVDGLTVRSRDFH
jgi:error-prone DNA polymerase